MFSDANEFLNGYKGSNTNLFSNANSIIEEGLQSKLFSGAALAVIRGEETLFEKYYGNVDYDPQSEPISDQTRFDLASITKIFSTTNIAFRFIDRGLIRLDDRVADFFPEAKSSAEIRIRHLLTHTSGQPAHFLLENEWNQEDDLFRVFMERPLANPIGQKEVYSCMGYILLGEILKKVSGKTLDTLLQEEVLEPLDLEHTSYGPLNTSSVSVAKTRDLRTGSILEGVVHDENARYQGGISANAGLFSTLKDVSTYAKMLLNQGKAKNAKNGEMYLSPSVLEAARKNYTLGLDEDRGLGFFLGSTVGSSFGDLLGDDSFGHTGFTGTSLIIAPKFNAAVVFLCNRVLANLEEGGNIVRMRACMHNSIAADLSSSSLLS